ncbi:glutamyl-Q tRNA(Asp) synthetase [Ancylobacter terrae]|uniref:glutamyl-Q tRNA(Asp) synthetase n=1 Tax=Ancylobacter sp. sgz301288 TaxID=3342077 RepID=UPI00385E46D7
MSDARPAFRFAPSPNGRLHLGHARSALLNEAMARARGGRFLLRIEDIDPTRCRPEFEAAIYEDLAWLGLHWERPVRRQSEHMADYAAALDRLEALDLVYPSFETRAEIARAVAARPDWPADPDGAPLFPFPRDSMSAAERARRRAAGEPHALRLDMAKAVALAGHGLCWREGGALADRGDWAGPMAGAIPAEARAAVADPDGSADPAGFATIAADPAKFVTVAADPAEFVTVAADPAAWGDVVLARKEVPTSYHLSVVVDDALQGVTHVVRGRDLYFATAIHRLLQHLLGLPAPSYAHHGLVLDGEGRKLSKSLRSTGIADLRAAGATPQEVRARALR